MNLSDLEKYQTENLFLLVGANPLPSLVAARLLAPENACIWLLHSSDDTGTANTKLPAERLEKALGDEPYHWKVMRQPVASADNVDIENAVAEIVRAQQLVGKRVGLNYTGGTKPMATHSYRALEDAFHDLLPAPIFSYLDPNALALRIDRRKAESEIKFEILKDAALRKLVTLGDDGKSNQNGIDALGKLHGFERVAYNDPYLTSDTHPALAELTSALARLHTTKSGIDEWKNWIKLLQSDTLADPLSQLAESESREAVFNALASLCGSAAQVTPARVAELLSGKPDRTLASCVSWLQGHWLEEHVRVTLKQLKSSLHWSSIAPNSRYRYKLEQTSQIDLFELDVAALIGYQLFVFSCKAKTDKGECKEGFLEVFVRAQQLGGEEARAVLVTLLETPQNLENELASTLNAEGKLKVFGREHLRNFQDELAKWHARTGV